MLTDRRRPRAGHACGRGPSVRGHDEVVLGSAAAAAAGAADAVAGLLEDVLDDAAEGEDDDDDEGRDAGDEQAVLDRGCAALVHLGQSGVEHDAQVVEHGGGSLVGVVIESFRTYRRRTDPSRERHKSVRTAVRDPRRYYVHLVHEVHSPYRKNDEGRGP